MIIAALAGLLFSFLIIEFETLGTVLFFAFIFAVILGILFLKDLNWGLYLMAFFLPFERLPSLEVGGISLRINHLIVIVTLLVFLIKGLSSKKLKFQIDKSFILIGLFLIVNLISISSALDLKRALQVLLFILFVITVYFLTTNLIQNKDVLKKVIWAIILSAGVSGVFGIYQFFGDLAGLPLDLTGLKVGYDKSTFGFPRVHATTLEPLYFANFLLIPLGLLIASTLNRQHLISQKLSWPILILILINFILTVSRGAYLAFGILLIFISLFLLQRFFTLKNIFILTLVITVALSGVWLFLTHAEPQALDEFISHVKVEDYIRGESVNARIVAYKQAIEAFSDKPWFGIGPGNYGPFVEGYPQETPKTGWKIVNNQYLETLAENGIFGLLVLIVLFLVVLFRALKAYFKTKDLYLKTIILGLSAAWIGILVQYNFFSTIYIIHIWFLLALLTITSNLVFSKNIKNNFQ